MQYVQYVQDNHCKDMEADPSRLIPRKLTANLELLIVVLKIVPKFFNKLFQNLRLQKCMPFHTCICSCGCIWFAYDLRLCFTSIKVHVFSQLRMLVSCFFLFPLLFIYLLSFDLWLVWIQCACCFLMLSRRVCFGGTLHQLLLSIIPRCFTP